jgi:hypothetical protein
MDFLQTQLPKAGLMKFAGILYVLTGASQASYEIRNMIRDTNLQTKGKDILNLFSHTLFNFKV